MKALTLALLLSVPVIPTAPLKPLRQPAAQLSKRTNGGRWYLAAGGHAVYCYGPVMIVPRADGELQKVVTLCRDGRAVVPLYETTPEPPAVTPVRREEPKNEPGKPRYPRL